VTTDHDGSFLFQDLGCNEPILLTAWAPGYYIGGGTPFSPSIPPRSSEVEILLVSHNQTDNPSYSWLPSGYSSGEGEDQGCAECHSSEKGGYAELAGLLPVDEWRQDAHASSAENPRFLSMYFGSDVDGRNSPPTQFRRSRDYGAVPLPPDPRQPYYGPGYKLDFPDSDGNCGSCHIPIAAVDRPYGVDPAELSETAAEGISCDFCHKIWDVRLEESGLPGANRPGVLSIEFRRPEPGHQLFMGPFDDVAPGEDTYLPLQRTSAFCAPCHFGSFWDVSIYNSYGEWLDSPYSDPVDGQTCQDCHMPKRGVEYFVRPDRGGLKRDPSRISSHRMPGALDEQLLQNALTMTVTVARGDDTVGVTVELVNDRTGHHVPTDSPLRHLILTVRLIDASGRPSLFLEGPTLPLWAGPESGTPGKAYAKVLEELWTEVSPSGAYWNQTRILSDNRLPAGGSDTGRYVFVTPRTEPLDLEVRLVYRRAFWELMEQKGWETPDILMERYRAHLPAAAPPE
jgi:mono/diheme cytochrome c family protein